MMRLKSAKFLFVSCTLFFIFCQFIELGLAAGHPPSPHKEDDKTDKAIVTEAEASGDDKKPTVKEGEEREDKKPMEDEKETKKEEEKGKGKGNRKGKEKEEAEEKGEEKEEVKEKEKEKEEEKDEEKAEKKSLNEIIEEDTKAIEGQKKGDIKTVEDTIVTLNLKCPNPSSDEMREKWEKMTDPEIRKEQKWISQCGFLLNIKDAVEDWLLLLRRQGKIEKDFELMTVRPILKSKKDAPPGWRYGPDEEEAEKKWEKELDFATVVKIYMAMDKKEDREALTDPLPADLIWENQFPYTFVKKKLMELNKYKKHGIEAQAKEIEKQLTSILETEQDVIAGNKLIFENEEHIEAMKEHLDNRDAQISQKLRHLWPDKVRKSLNAHAKGKAGNVKKLLTGKTGHAKRSRTI